MLDALAGVCMIPFMQSILTFLSVSPRFLAFGFLVAMFSSFGQTFFIALSGGHIRAAFGLSHGDYGLIYSAGTLSSAALLIWAGNKIDHFDLRAYTSVVCLGLAAACISMSFVSSALWLIGVIFALRFTGQGLMSHIATVSMARYFGEHRGKAISIATMGHPAGEAILPTVAVALIAWFGWREVWLGVGLVLAIGLVPLMLWLLRGHAVRHANLQEALSTENAADQSVRNWTRGQMLRDPRFYVLVPNIIALAMIGTGITFHQVHLVEVKGWTLAWYAGAFVVYAIATTVSAAVTGILVDRYGATRLLRYDMLPALVGFLILANFSEPWVAIAYMAFAGTSAGAISITHSAVWAELYGVAHLGGIKALATSLMVLGSALGPPLMGVAIDAGQSMETISLVGAGFVAVSIFMVIFIFPRFQG
jgi:MFS family permease